ncbi:MAG: TolC family protein, partial [Flavobacterium sp.]|nr:TolC family protein [Flavobacterium sp.]
MNTKIQFSLILIGLSLGAFAQDTITISKNELLEKVADKNLQIKIAEKTLAGAKADYNESNSLFLPKISASHTAMMTTNPLMAFGSKLNQEILTAADFNPALLNDPDKTENYATRIEVLQPLINIDGLYGRKAAKSKMEAFDLQLERTKEYLGFEVNKAFMQLQLAYKAVEVLEKANATAQANLKLIDNYNKQGLLQKTDLLSVQVRVNEVKNQLQYAKSNVQNASDYLAFLLDDSNENKVYKPLGSIENTIEISTFETNLSANRKDVLAMDKSVEAYEKMAKMSQMNFLPRLNAFGSYEM